MMKNSRAGIAKYGLVTVFILLFSIIFGLGLNYFKLQKSVSTLSNERFVITVSELRKQAEQSLTLGFDVSELPITSDHLKDIKSKDSLVSSVVILGAKGVPLRATEQTGAAISQDLTQKLIATAAASKKSPFFMADGDSRLVGQAIYNAYDNAVGIVVLNYSSSVLVQLLNTMLLDSIQLAAIAFAIALVVATLLFYFVIRQGREPTKLFSGVVMGVALLIVNGALTYGSYSVFSNELPKELAKWGQAFGKTEASLIQKAVNDGGLKLSELVGVQEHFDKQIAENKNLQGLTISDRAGKTLFTAGVDSHQTTSVSILDSAGKSIGSVVTFLNPALSAQLLSENIQDLFIVLLVVLFLSFEVMAMANVGTHSPSSGSATLQKIRAPAFLIFLAEEFTRTTIPTISNELLLASYGYSTSLLVSLPIVAFMIVVAFGQPLSTGVIARFGRQRTLVLAVVLSCLGFFVSASTQSFELLMLGRVVGGASYALIFISVQDYVIQNTTKTDRAIGFALLVGVIMVATVCGPALGGIIADNFGNKTPFYVAAVLCAMSLLWLIPMARNGGQHKPQSASVLGAYKALSALKSAKFSAICFLNAIPAKMVLAGVCFYLIPMYVVSIGENQAFTGRLLMIYAVVMVLLVPVFAKFANTYKRQLFNMNVGAILSGIGLVTLGLSAETVALVICVSLIGLGQAMSISSQSSLVGQVVSPSLMQRHTEPGIYGAYRFNERLGNAVGPIMAALLIVAVGYQSTFLVFGILSIAATLLGYVLLRSGDSKAAVTG
jgi:predicted MFS family arabinose efflux permease